MQDDESILASLLLDPEYKEWQQAQSDTSIYLLDEMCALGVSWAYYIHILTEVVYENAPGLHILVRLMKHLG